MPHPLLMALFEDVSAAAGAARELHSLGIGRADLSVVARDHQVEGTIAESNRRQPGFGDRGLEHGVAMGRTERLRPCRDCHRASRNGCRRCGRAACGRARRSRRTRCRRSQSGADQGWFARGRRRAVARADRERRSDSAWRTRSRGGSPSSGNRDVATQYGRVVLRNGSNEQWPAASYQLEHRLPANRGGAMARRGRNGAFYGRSLSGYRVGGEGRRSPAQAGSRG